MARADFVDEKYALEGCDGLLIEETGDGSAEPFAEMGDGKWLVKDKLMLFDTVLKCPIPSRRLGL